MHISTIKSQSIQQTFIIQFNSNHECGLHQRYHWRRWERKQVTGNTVILNFCTIYCTYLLNGHYVAVLRKLTKIALKYLSNSDYFTATLNSREQQMQDLDSWETIKPTTLYYNLHLSTTNYKDMSKFKKNILLIIARYYYYVDIYYIHIKWQMSWQTKHETLLVVWLIQSGF